MTQLAFPPAAREATLADLARDFGLPVAADPTRRFKAVTSIGSAGPDDVTVFLDGDDPDDLAASRAGACFVRQSHVALVPSHMIPLVIHEPLEALRRALAIFHPAAETTPGSVFGHCGIDPAAIVHGDAILERNVTVDPGAVVGPQVEIGAGTTIGANAVIGTGVRIGRGCVVDPLVSIVAALIGDRVRVRAGARIGLGSEKGQNIGRVIVQDDVDIGANAVIERGVLGDTMIGDGAKVGAHAVIAADALVERPRS